MQIFFNKIFQVCIYSTPPPQTGCDTRSIFKQSKASLNSEFFCFSSRLVAYYLFIAMMERRKDGFMPFLRALVKVKYKQLFPALELKLAIPFPKTTSIMLSIPPYVTELKITCEETNGEK